MSTEIDKATGPKGPKELAAGEDVKKIHKIIFPDCKMMLIVTVDTLKISKECVRHIIHEYLS